MKFDIYGRFQLEVLRDEDHWSVYRLASGKRMPVHDFKIPPEVEPNDIVRYLDDVFQRGRSPREERSAPAERNEDQG